jgi:hypothetical protein
MTRPRIMSAAAARDEWIQQSSHSSMIGPGGKFDQIAQIQTEALPGLAFCRRRPYLSRSCPTSAVASDPSFHTVDVVLSPTAAARSKLLATSPDGATEALMRNFNSAVNLQVKCELPLTMGGFQMAIEIGAVQSVSMMSGDPGWGFHLRDCTGRHWITISYRTEADAKAAREKIEAATADAEIMVHSEGMP